MVLLSDGFLILSLSGYLLAEIPLQNKQKQKTKKKKKKKQTKQNKKTTQTFCLYDKVIKYLYYIESSANCCDLSFTLKLKTMPIHSVASRCCSSELAPLSGGRCPTPDSLSVLRCHLGYFLPAGRVAIILRNFSFYQKMVILGDPRDGSACRGAYDQSW